MTLTNKNSNSLQNFLTSPEEKFCRKGKDSVPQQLSLLKGFGLKKSTICLYERKYFLEIPRIRKDMRREIFFFKFAPFSTLYVQNQLEIWQQICPAALLFIWPFLTYAAKQLASCHTANKAL